MRSRPAKALGLDPDERLPARSRPVEGVRLPRAQGGPAERGDARRSWRSRASGSIPRSCGSTRRAGGVAGARLRRHGQPRASRGSSARSTRRSPAGPGARRSSRTRSGRALDVVSTRPRRPGKSVRLTIDHQIQANAEADPRGDGAAVRRQGGDGDRDGPAARVRSSPWRTRRGFNANRFADDARRIAPQPRRHGHVRARLDVQARDHRRRARGRRRHAADDVHAAADDPRRRPRDPRGALARDRADDRHARSSSSRRTSARSRSRSGSAPARLASWIDRFGFGKPTGVDFPGERPGFALPLDQWSGSTIGTVPIGHGIAVTPMQMARAYAAIANGGVLVEPHLVERVGASRMPSATGSRRIVSRARVEADDVDAPRRRPRGNGHRGGDPRLHRRRQDRHRGEDRPERALLDVPVRRVVRRPRPGEQAAARDHGHGRRAARRRSGAASSRRRPSGRSRASTCSTSRSRRTRPSRREAQRSARRQTTRRLGGGPARLALANVPRVELDALIRCARARASARSGEVTGGRPVEIGDLAYDTRSVTAGALFFCVPGAACDGHDLAWEASSGARRARRRARRSTSAVPQLVVADVPGRDGRRRRRVLRRADEGARGRRRHRHERQDDDGVPAALDARGGRSPAGARRDRGMDGRRRAAAGAASRRRRRSTSSGSSARCSTRATGASALEASSHGAALQRLDRVRFDALVFTNLTQDHLDLHGTMEEYFQAKRRLFTGAQPPPAAVNVGDEWGRRLADELAGAAPRAARHVRARRESGGARRTGSS